MTDENFILAIESAIVGGSCALANGDRVIGETRGTGGVSRAEDLLSDIDGMLNRHSLRPTDISNIVVSSGPGSFTGIRIGIASALGFAAGLAISPIQISLFEAMAVSASLTSPTIIAVPAGRGMVQSSGIQITSDSIKCLLEPQAISAFDLFRSLATSRFEDLIVFAGHFEDEILAEFPGTVTTLDISPAAALVAAATDTRVRRSVQPILISKS